MSLLNPHQTQLMLANGAAFAAGRFFDPVPVVKLHTLDAGGVWLLVSLQADRDRAYGLCDAGLGSPELGHVSLKALAQVRGPRGMPVVVDTSFKARQTLSAYLAEALRDGAVRD